MSTRVGGCLCRNPSIEHPSYGSVIAHDLNDQRPELEIPPFIAVEGGSVGPGFLGMAWAPLNVDSNGQIRNLEARGLNERRTAQRWAALGLIENGFIRPIAGNTSDRQGSLASDHWTVYQKTANWPALSPAGVDEAITAHPT